MERHDERLRMANLRWYLGDARLLVEIGANDGSDSFAMLDAFPSADLHCFEPDPRPCLRFLEKAQSRPDRCRLSLNLAAVSGEAGHVTLHMSSGSQTETARFDWDRGSSIRQPTGHLQAYPWAKFNQTCIVPAVTLDDWGQNVPGLVDFIWIDAQGSEPQIFSGGKAVLARTRFIYFEWTDEPMYDGWVSLNEIRETHFQGWELLGLYEMDPRYKAHSAFLKNSAIRGS